MRLRTFLDHVGDILLCDLPSSDIDLELLLVCFLDVERLVEDAQGAEAPGAVVAAEAVEGTSLVKE